MSKITIYHNPACGTSRTVLQLIRDAGIEPEVIEYLKTPPTRVKLLALIKQTGLPIRDIMRKKGTPYEELELDDAKWSDDQLIDFMLLHPVLLNRPIVATAHGAKLCRPAETVLELLK